MQYYEEENGLFLALWLMKADYDTFLASKYNIRW